MNKNILVTGGAGFIGTNLIKRLIKDGNKVVSVDNYSSGKRKNHVKGCLYLNVTTENLNYSLNFFREEIYRHFLEKTYDFDLIFHLGEYSKIVPSFKEPEKVFEYNIEGSIEVIKYCTKNNIPLIYSSSSTCLAEEGENHSPYTFSKSFITKLIKNYGKWYGLKYNICYFYNVYGDKMDTCNDGYESVISIFEKQWRKRENLTICGDGKQKRDFTDVRDIVDGLIEVSKNINNEEYQLGSGEEFTILELAYMFDTVIEFVNERPGDRKRSLADVENTKSKLENWKPKYHLKDFIERIKNV